MICENVHLSVEQVMAELYISLKGLQVYLMIKIHQHGLYKISVSSQSHVVSNSLETL